MVITKQEVEDSPPSPSGDEPPLKFITSSKGTNVLLYDGYVYHTNSTVKNSTYFKCGQRNKGCLARITLKNFNKKDCSFESFTITEKQHSNHARKLLNQNKNPGKEKRKNKVVQPNPEVLENSKHVCLFCLKPLLPGYLDITNLENVMSSGHILTIPLNDPGRNSQAFDLLCTLLNVKWKRWRDALVFDQKKSLPLCMECQTLYQEIFQVHQQIKELEIHVNKRAKIIRDKIRRTEKSGSHDGERTQLEVLGLNRFRKKVADPEFDRVNQDNYFGSVPSKSSEIPQNSTVSISTKSRETDESSCQDNSARVTLIKQEVDVALNELLDEDDRSWAGDESHAEDVNSLDPDMFKNLGEDGTTGNSGPTPEKTISKLRSCGRRTGAEDKKKREEQTTSSEEDNNGNSDSNYSGADSPDDEDDDSDSDFEVSKTSTKTKGITRPHPSTKSLSRLRTTFKKKVSTYKPKKETAVNTCHICSARIVGHKGFMKHYRVEHPKEHRYTCIYCKRHFDKVSKVISHQRNKHTGERPFQCSSCPSSFANIHYLRMHIKNCHSTSVYRCRHCDKVCSTKTEHMNHLAAMHGETSKGLFYMKSKNPTKMFTCHICEFEVQGAGPFIQHYKDVHPEEKRYTCKFCKRHFPYIRDCITHQRRHTGEKPVKCTICGKGFVDKRALQAHNYYIHTEREKKFPCPHCPDKIFTFKSLLDSHMIVHQEFVIICKACGKNLKTQRGFISHNRIFHDGEAECTEPVSDPSKKTLESLGLPPDIHLRRKCHVCLAPIPGRALIAKHFADCHPDHPGDFLMCRCGEQFADYKKVYDHAMRKHPGGEKPYQCEQCPKRFITSTELRNHSKIHIPIEERHMSHICDVCGTGLASADCLVKHMRTHQDNPTRNVCELCGKSYAHIRGLQHHHKISHLKLFPYKCPFENCGKAFPVESKLIKHQNFHTGEISYTCEVCNKNFHYSGSLRRHIREVHNKGRHKGRTPRKKTNEGGGNRYKQESDAELAGEYSGSRLPRILSNYSSSSSYS